VQFDRFTSWGFLTNWGSYSQAENELLKKELDVANYIASLEAFMTNDDQAKALVKQFKKIAGNESVKASEMVQIGRDLDQLQQKLKLRRVHLLNANGPNIPVSHRVFKNHQPNALVGEIRSYLHFRTMNRGKGDPLKAGFVIHYQADLRNHGAKNFHGIIATGSKVNWALDVEGYLSIGDPVSTKHSVVAVGKDVIGAGTAQLKMDDRKDKYLAAREFRDKASGYMEEFKKTGERMYKETAENYLATVKQWEDELNGWVPKKDEDEEKSIVLDFDSGHYAPSGAWKKVALAWKGAGYKVEWSDKARHV
jgi:hypothetical protein